MIAPLSRADVDIFLVLDSGYYSFAGAGALLDRIRAVLRKKYPTTPRSAATAKPSPSASPTSKWMSYQVSIARWRIPHPEFTVSPMDRDRPKGACAPLECRQRAHNGNLVPLIKMIKQWNRCHSGLLRSFHLEAIILNVLTNVTISDFPSGARYVFDKTQAAVQQAIADPAGYSGNLGAYLDTPLKIYDVYTRLKRWHVNARAKPSSLKLKAVRTRLREMADDIWR